MPGDTSPSPSVYWFTNPLITTLVSVGRVSTDVIGVEGNAASSQGIVSANGRYVVFQSSATNLVPGDGNGIQDVFLKDTQTGAISRVSTSSSGSEANGASFARDISADGRYILFQSAATNLVAGDTNGLADMFIKDIQTEIVSRVSTTSASTQADGTNDGVAALSSDGHYVAFSSFAQNLVSGDANGTTDVFIKDTQTGSISRVSTGATGSEADGASQVTDISSDGRYVVFKSNATNLVAGDTGATDIFVKDTQTGAITRVSTDMAGAQADADSNDARVSSSGRYIVFASEATNLVAGDTNSASDIFLKDIQTGAISLVSASALGTQANAGSYIGMDVSADGRYVVFVSDATNLIFGDTNGTRDVFVKDTQTGNIGRISRTSSGGEVNGASDTPTITADGKYVVFQSTGTNVVAGDISAASSVFYVSNPLIAAPPVCFTAGTFIRTLAGECLVETLAIGDTVTLANGGSTTIKWIGRQTIPLATARIDGYLPVLIRAGALGDAVPVTDLYVSPDHAMLFENTLIHAGAMVNGHSIIALATWSGDVEYFHIETEQHEIILANGAPAETFIDNQARQRFDNAAEYEALYPDEKPMKELYLPRVKFRRQLSRISVALLDHCAAGLPSFVAGVG